MKRYAALVTKTEGKTPSSESKTRNEPRPDDAGVAS